MKIEEIVNTVDYPIMKDSAVRKAIVDRSRQSLSENLYCSLAGFVTGDALRKMAAEALGLQSEAFHNNSLRNCYLHQEGDTTLPPAHPRNLKDRSSVRMIAYDQLTDTSPLKTFYHSREVRDLVADIVGEGPLYDNEDPYQPANYVCYRDGDESSWHFDADNSFTMTLMVQAADRGGDFEMSPNTRTDENPNYEHVSEVLRGECAEETLSVGRAPGELCIFRGCNSLHRVSKVEGETLRIMGVFVYEFVPGVVGDPGVNATIYGPRTRVTG